MKAQVMRQTSETGETLNRALAEFFRFIDQKPLGDGLRKKIHWEAGLLKPHSWFLWTGKNCGITSMRQFKTLKNYWQTTGQDPWSRWRQAAEKRITLWVLLTGWSSFQKQKECSFWLTEITLESKRCGSLIAIQFLDGRLFTKVYNIQHLKSNSLDSVCKVCITTIQRLYSMLKGEKELDRNLRKNRLLIAGQIFRERSGKGIRRGKKGKNNRLQPWHPYWVFRFHCNRWMPSINLSPLEAGAWVFRCLYHWVDCNAIKSNTRFF